MSSPAKTSRRTFLLLLAGAGGGWAWLTACTASPPGSARTQPPSNPLPLTPATASLTSTTMPPATHPNLLPPNVSVLSVNGVPTFAIDGQPYLTPIFETYDPEGTYFGAFARAGTRVFSMNTNLGDDVFGRGQPTWPAADRFDYSGLDAWVHKALAARPDALIMPRVCCWEPVWWVEAYPDELELWEDGAPLHADRGYAGERKRGSLSSARWREDMVHSLR